MELRAASETELIDITGRVHCYEPTPELRLLTIQDADGLRSPAKLQQKWMERHSGEFEWRDVPTEVEYDFIVI